ncbi:MAG: hypothetical protein UH543_00525 [Bacteroidales bacterium]|nr:hypothetical protein [Bacteroidales bacterium]
MAEKEQKTTSKGRKTTKKVEEATVDPRQIDLIEGKTVEELAQEDQKAKVEAEIKLVLDKTRTSIKTEANDFTLDEIRNGVKLVNQGTNRVSVVYDPRNYEGIQSIISGTGIKKEVVYDIAIKRFLDWQEKKSTSFPFASVKDVTPLGTRTTIVISKATKERLDTFCVDNLQQVNLIVNLALQALIEEVKPFNK